MLRSGNATGHMDGRITQRIAGVLAAQQPTDQRVPAMAIPPRSLLEASSIFPTLTLASAAG